MRVGLVLSNNERVSFSLVPRSDPSTKLTILIRASGTKITPINGATSNRKRSTIQNWSSMLWSLIRTEDPLVLFLKNCKCQMVLYKISDIGYSNVRFVTRNDRYAWSEDEVLKYWIRDGKISQWSKRFKRRVKGSIFRPVRNHKFLCELRTLTPRIRK